jgi:DNA-binding transcriptional LysR family regulator
LAVAPSTVTACVETLEVSLFGESRSTGKRTGVKPDGSDGLFKIVGRDAQKTFTESGIDCYWRAAEILRLQKSFGAETQRQRDFVTIGSFNALLSSYIPLALQPFLSAENRRDRPVFRLHELDTPEIFEAVKYGRVDFAIGSLPTSRDKGIADAMVKVECLDLMIERGLLVHPDHSLAKKKVIVAADLAPEVVFRFPVRATTPGLETWLAPNYEEGGDNVEVLTFGVMLQFVKLNLGVALVANIPGEIQDAIESKKVSYRPLPTVPSATVAAYLPREGFDSLSRGAKKVYLGMAEFFRARAAEQQAKGRRKSKQSAAM